MYEMIVNTLNPLSFGKMIYKTRYYSLWAATCIANKAQECDDVISITIVDTSTGEIMLEYNSN